MTTYTWYTTCMRDEILRAEAKLLGLSRYSPGYKCPNGHGSDRQTSDGACIQCRRDRENARYNDVTKHVKGYHEARTLRYRRKLKLDVINGYGGKCTCCGEPTFEFLSVDHMNNDGKKHRIEISGRNAGSSQSIYRWLRDNNFPAGYTVLCFNCNMARALYSLCPHQKGEKLR